jgi:SsrA-binding protein
MSSELCSNKKAYFHYEIVDTFEAGIKLLGTEVKSLRDHGGNLLDSYILLQEGYKALLKNASIAPYKMGNIHNHEEKRDRILLLHKKEIRQLKSKVTEKGLALVPLAMYFKNGKIKLKFGLARGKKLHDKRQSEKEKEQKASIRDHSR